MEGKVCIITGASSGIGEATAVLLASRGAKITLCGRDESRLAAVVDRCVSASHTHSDRFLSVSGDVTDKEVRESIVRKTVDKFGRIDVLVPNAAVVLPTDTLMTITEENFDLLISTNLKSVLFLIKETASELEKTKGSIVVVSSASTFLPFPTQLSYAMSKAAIDHMVKSLAVDLGQRGIRINTVNPSFVHTRATRAMGDIDVANKMIEEMELKQQPLHGRLVTLEELAQAIAFLVSTEASFITGDNLKVDGGRALIGTPVFDISGAK